MHVSCTIRTVVYLGGCARLVPSLRTVKVLQRALLLNCLVLLAASAPWPSPTLSRAQTPLIGRVLAASRGQVAWLDLLAPRPTPLTQLVRPAYPADVAAASSGAFAVASVVSASATGGMGSDLVLLDLQAGTSRTLLGRQSDAESLDVPAIWPDGSGVLYQRSNLRAVVPMPGQAAPQYQSRVEQISPDGSNPVVVLDNARYPGPAPDGGHLAFVRSADRGAGIFAHSLQDGQDAELVSPGQFLALAYPRYSPDGQQIAFAAISLLAPIGGTPSWFHVLSPEALAHGFPWDIWVVQADGTGLRQISDILDDDPSVAWSPDGAQLLVYGGWGSFVVDAASGDTTSLPYLVGYGSIAWLPE
jgi:Tol biopolymer transport system component